MNPSQALQTVYFFSQATSLAMGWIETLSSESRAGGGNASMNDSAASSASASSSARPPGQSLSSTWSHFCFFWSHFCLFWSHHTGYWTTLIERGVPYKNLISLLFYFMNRGQRLEVSVNTISGLVSL